MTARPTPARIAGIRERWRNEQINGWHGSAKPQNHTDRGDLLAEVDALTSERDEARATLASLHAAAMRAVDGPPGEGREDELVFLVIEQEDSRS